MFGLPVIDRMQVRTERYDVVVNTVSDPVDQSSGFTAVARIDGVELGSAWVSYDVATELTRAFMVNDVITEAVTAADEEMYVRCGTV